MDETWDVVVVGGGLAGLTAAASAAGGGRSVLVLEGQEGGGRATTDRVGRFRFNRGAHALYRTTPGRSVLERLGVKVVGSPPPTKGALARIGDQVGRLPVGPGTGAVTGMLSPRDKLVLGRLYAGIRRWKPAELAGLSAAEWYDDLGLDRGSNIRLMLEALFRTATYVVDFERLSADVVASSFQAVVVGNVEYVHGGWVTLVDGLAAAADRSGARRDGGARVRQVIPDGGRVRVETERRTVMARRVILAAGTPEATAALLPEPPAAWSRLGPPARVACLDLGLASVPPVGFILGLDQPLYLSRHSPPNRLSPEGTAVYQTMRYLRPEEDPSPEDTRTLLAEHCRYAGIDAGAAEESRYLHRMVASAAVPIPENGGLRGRPGVETELPGVLVAGDWVGPQGHLADASLVSGEAAGRTAVESLDREAVTQPAG